MKHFYPVLFIFLLITSIAACKKGSDNVSVTSISITSIMPDSGSYGTKVAVAGNGFSTLDSVKINGVPCTIEYKSNDSLVIIVPKAAGTGPITIVAGNKTYTGPILNFHYTSRVITYAGSNPANNDVDGIGLNASFDLPTDLLIDSIGNLFVTEYANTPRLRKVDTLASVTTFAGDGTWGYKDGASKLAEFSPLFGIAKDASGNLYLSDYYNFRVRKISSNGIVSSLAGNGLLADYDPYPMTNGVGSKASFGYLWGIAVDSIGDIFVVDGTNYSIRKITSDSIVSTFAGTGHSAYIDGKGTSAAFYNPRKILIDSKGNLLVSDQAYIRKITPDGTVSTLTVNPAPNEGALYAVFAMAWDKTGNIILTDGNAIRKIAPDGTLTTIAGGAAGFADGPVKTAMFNIPGGIAVDKRGDIYVADGENQRIRKILIQ